MDDVSPSLGVTVVRAPVARPDDLDKAFSDAIAQGADAMTVLTHGFSVLNADRIMALGAKHKIPVLYGWHDFVVQGSCPMAPISSFSSAGQRAMSIVC